MMNVNTETRTIKMSYDNFESAIISFLYSISAIDDDTNVIGTDFGIEVNEEGMIEFDIEVAMPRGSSNPGIFVVKPRLELVSNK
jgi:hypothetical protein